MQCKHGHDLTRPENQLNFDRHGNPKGCRECGRIAQRKYERRIALEKKEHRE